MADSRLYEVLGVRRDATDAEIKRSYHKLAKEFHPDKNPSAGDKFKEISYAFDILSDPEKRQFYDRHGMQGMQESGGMDGRFPSGDLFSSLFGNPFFGMMGGMGGMRSSRMGPQRGEDTIHPLKVSLEDVYNGKIARLELSKNIICKSCNGVGGKSDAIVVCRICGGQGIQTAYKMLSIGMTQRFQSRCVGCNGQGQTFNEKDLCHSCKGKKVINETKILEVHIDKGMKEGQKITFAGEGDQQPDTQPGHVYILLQEKPHARFQRDRDNLYMEHKITLTEALCGFSFVIKHLDGRELIIRNPQGTVIKPGDVRAIKGEGMPHYKNPFEKGNLYIKFDITFPDNHFQTPEVLKVLEGGLPPRPAFVMPVGENVEEVDLNDYIEDAKREEAYSYEDEEHCHGGPGGLQCTQQ